MAEFNNLTPITRREQFLQDIADGTVDKTPITREEWFLAQIADAVHSGGGGSSLPSYTSADKGKGLFLAEDAEHPTAQTIVSEQTVSVTSESGLSGVAITHTGEIVNGETYTMTVNGVSESVTASAMLDSVVCILAITGGSAVISSGDGTDYTFTALTDGYVPIEGTYTISLTKSVPSVAPAWTNALPAVTEEDDGDVLTVVDGAWDKATPSGGGVAIIEGESSLLGDDLTTGYSDILAMYDGEGPVILHLLLDQDGEYVADASMLLNRDFVSDGNDGYLKIFTAVYANSFRGLDALLKVLSYQITIDEQNNTAVLTKIVKEINFAGIS